MRPPALAALLLLASCAAGGVAHAREAPDWLMEVIASAPGAPADHAPALDLLRDELRTVAADGVVRRRLRRVMKAWNADARPHAIESIDYDSGADRVIAVRAWRMARDGRVVEVKRDRVVDRALDLNALYDEQRAIHFDLSGEALPGAVIGWEFETETRSVLTQCLWQSQEALPVTVSRFVLRLPRGWRADAVSLGGDSLAPVIRDNEWSWERRALPPLMEEPVAPPLNTLALRLGVSWSPGTPGAGSTAFGGWKDVGRWLSTLGDPQAAADDALRQRARLVVGDAASDRERLSRLGRFVQDLPYVAISLDLDRGRGYQPRPAVRVLQQGYGDCKDKANLLRAMLRETGIESWLTVVNAGSPGFASRRWPSPGNFDHCILAVRAPWAAGSSASVSDSVLGNLLLFDPTDPATPVGAAPAGLGGEPALVVAGEASGLITIPGGDHDANTSRREIHGEIGADGSLRVVIRERAVGLPATRLRSLLRRSGPAQFTRTMESWAARTVNSVQITALEPGDDRDSSAFRLAMTLEAPHYATRAGTRLMTFRPAIVSRREVTRLADGVRRLPVKLEPESWSETAVLRMPRGSTIDELPAAGVIETPFARYEARYEARGDTLRLYRSAVIERAEVPAARYAEVRDFFLRMTAMEQAVVVLQTAAEPGARR